MDPSLFMQHGGDFTGMMANQQSCEQISSSQSSSENQLPTPSFVQTPSIRKKPKRKRIITSEQRQAANIRERKRMFSMNDGFDELRQYLPRFSYENKLSRIETLRLAIIYIQYMTDIVKHGKDPSEATVRSLKHGWPSSKPRYPFPLFPPGMYPGMTPEFEFYQQQHHTANPTMFVNNNTPFWH